MVFKYSLILALLLGISHSFAQTFQNADPINIALFPQQNDLRNTLSLSGIWQFQKDTAGVGEKENWQNGLQKPRSIAVPGSWNDQFTDNRDYLGIAWYQKETYIPNTWKGQKIFIRIGSANYASKIWINGVPLGQHEGGHLPFAFDISTQIKWGANNRITLEIENILKPSRVPTGGAVSGGLFTSNPKANFDFFPYAGLNRDVILFTKPATASIKDVTLKTTFKGKMGFIDVKVDVEGKASKGSIAVLNNGKIMNTPLSISGNLGTATIQIPDVRLWSPDDPYLYQLDVTIDDAKSTLDHYSLETGVRTISANNKQILLNDKPVFLKGFGKHEDFPIFGRGTANPVIVKDYALLKWVGANSYRTSHYPYDEEYMRMADREGILIIDEIPAVGLYFQGDTTELKLRQAACKQYINELIMRDKNHPSVVMWSVANEPFPPAINLSPTDVKAADPKSIALFKELFDLVKEKDPTRLKTLVGVMGGPIEWLALSDVVCINRYWGWYTNPGDIKTGASLLSKELDELHQKLNKPIIITEFGADTQVGMHADEPEMFTEEYQMEFIKAYLDVADTKDFMAGMHVWAFADFKTGQGIIRFGGMNYKGVFTRDRKPKMAAHFLRSRWLKK
jgi:beta-glucuronidase